MRRMWLPCVPLLPSFTRLRLLYVQVGVMPKNVQRKFLTIKHFTIMKKFLVIREYIDPVMTPSVYAQFDDYESANKLAKEKNKGTQFVKYLVFEQSK